MSRYAQAGSRWARARNAHCSSWAQNYNQQFRTMTAGSSYLLKTCEYFPALHGGIRQFPEGIGKSSITQLLADLTDDSGSSKLAGVDEAVGAYLSGMKDDLISCFNTTLKLSPTMSLLRRIQIQL